MHGDQRGPATIVVGDISVCARLDVPASLALGVQAHAESVRRNALRRARHLQARYLAAESRALRRLADRGTLTPHGIASRQLHPLDTPLGG